MNPVFLSLAIGLWVFCFILLIVGYIDDEDAPIVAGIWVFVIALIVTIGVGLDWDRQHNQSISQAPAITNVVNLPENTK